jgi:hypothetical protein
MVSQVAAFASRRWRVPTELLRVEVEPLHGGLESAVVRARLSHPEGYDTSNGLSGALGCRDFPAEQ